MTSDYKLGVGKLKVDLSRLPAGQPVQVKAHVGMGRLEIDVPRDAKVALTTHVKAGDIDALGHPRRRAERTSRHRATA